MAEINKVKELRKERVLKKARHEEQMAQLAKERARAELGDQEIKEEEFHFNQSKLRSVIRMREGRMKPIDVLLKYLNGLDDLAVDLKESFSVFKGLTVKEMTELRDDIKMHVHMDRLTLTHVDYWEALMVVCDWELAEAHKKDAFDRARARGEEPPAELLVQERGLHSSIETNVRNLLEGKSSDELEVLQTQIESQMRSGAAKVVEYWEAVLNRLHLYKAKARLREIHAECSRPTKAPTYTIHNDGNSSETCIIRFHASPPYEDIAFRIVNKDWEYSRKMGFKCTFERGILQLHFNFKRLRYRR